MVAHHSDLLYLYPTIAIKRQSGHRVSHKGRSQLQIVRIQGNWRFLGEEPSQTL